MMTRDLIAACLPAVFLSRGGIDAIGSVATRGVGGARSKLGTTWKTEMKRTETDL